MSSTVPYRWCWLVNIPITNLSKSSAPFKENERKLQGTHIDSIGPYFLQIGVYRKYEFLCHYLTMNAKIIFGTFPQKFTPWFSISLTVTQNHTYNKYYVKNIDKYGFYTKDCTECSVSGLNLHTPVDTIHTDPCPQPNCSPSCTKLYIVPRVICICICTIGISL
jgi:hypothetical protein